jgi:hypothetical protein
LDDLRREVLTTPGASKKGPQRLRKSNDADLFVQEMNATAGGTGGGMGVPSATNIGGTGGGMGVPSATNIGGTGGGIGVPSATSTGGTGGGIGVPSATLTLLLKLTIALTGATINAIRTKSARHNLFLFTVEPPRLTMNGNRQNKNYRFKKFCVRNSAGSIWKHSHNSNKTGESSRISP